MSTTRAWSGNTLRLPRLCVHALEPYLARFDRAQLDDHVGAIFALTPDLLLAGFNRAWFEFARANGGEPQISRDWPLGRPLIDAIAVELRGFYVAGYRSVLTSRRPWSHEYECHSPQIERRFHQTVLVLGDGAGLLVVNSLRHAAPHDPERPAVHPAPVEDYRELDGFYRQCASCRRFRHARHANRWDWVPAWVGQPPRATSHVLCAICFEHHYGKAPGPAS